MSWETLSDHIPNTTGWISAGADGVAEHSETIYFRGVTDSEHILGTTTGFLSGKEHQNSQQSGEEILAAGDTLSENIPGTAGVQSVEADLV